MIKEPPTLADSVVILGAGFTKAFCRNAPLAIDNYGPNLRKVASGDPPLSRLLQNSTTGRKVDIERLLTRLTSRLPGSDIADG